MEGTVFIIIIILTLILTITSTLILIQKLGSTNSRRPNLPPGPRKLPVIGNLHQMVGGLAHHRLRDLAREYGPLMHLQLGEISTIVVSSPEVAKAFLQTHDLNFATRPSLPSANIIFYDGRGMAFAAYGEYWKQMRKIFVQELLGHRRVHSLRLVREEAASELVRSIRSSCCNSTVNLSRMLISMANAMTYRTAFGTQGQLEEAFRPVLQKILLALGGFNLCDVFPSSKLLRVVSGTQAKLKKLHQEADVILEAIINDHKARRLGHSSNDGGIENDHEEDLVDALLNFSDDPGLGFPITNLEIKAVILDIFLAASESSSGTINWAMAQLMKNPRAMQKAQTEVRRVCDVKGRVDEASLGELHYLKLVVKETFRLHPAPFIGPREARENVVIDGYQIPAKARIVINAWAIGRDPEHWAEPEKFYPERFLDSSIDYKGANFELIPFGAGRRACPGITYGAAVVHLTLANLLYHFDWELSDGILPQDLDMSEESSLATKKKGDLLVTPVPYHPKAL